MRDKNILAEFLVSVILIIFLVLFLSPTDLLMPMNATGMTGIIVIVLFFIFAGLIWREKGNDERESLHVLGAGRISFIVGLLIAIIGIVKQSLSHDIDAWLIFTAIGMILAKVGYRFYSSRNK